MKRKIDTEYNTITGILPNEFKDTIYDKIRRTKHHQNMFRMNNQLTNEELDNLLVKTIRMEDQKEVFSSHLSEVVQWLNWIYTSRSILPDSYNIVIDSDNISLQIADFWAFNGGELIITI